MKKLVLQLFIFSLTLFVFKANAQVSIDIKGGLSIPNLSSGSGAGSTPLSTGYSSRLGPDFGIDVDFKISNLFSIQPGLQYSAEGGKKDGYQAFPTPAAFAAQYPAGEAPTYLYANYNSEAKINYLMLPILAKVGWNLGSGVRLYVDAGPFVGYLLNAKQVTSGTSQWYYDSGMTQPVETEQGPLPAQNFDNTQDIKSSIHQFNFGIEGNVGFAFKFGKSFLFVEGGGNYGFLNIQKYAADGKNEIGAGTAAIGYGFWIK